MHRSLGRNYRDLRRQRALSGKGRSLGIEVVRLAALAPIMPVRTGDFEHLDAGLLPMAQKAGTVGSGRLHADALENSE